jgi:hypothetical protein
MPVMCLSERARAARACHGVSAPRRCACMCACAYSCTDQCSRVRACSLCVRVRTSVHVRAGVNMRSVLSRARACGRVRVFSRVRARALTSSCARIVHCRLRARAWLRRVFVRVHGVRACTCARTKTRLRAFVRPCMSVDFRVRVLACARAYVRVRARPQRPPSPSAHGDRGASRCGRRAPISCYASPSSKTAITSAAAAAAAAAAAPSTASCCTDAGPPLPAGAPRRRLGIRTGGPHVRRTASRIQAPHAWSRRRDSDPA